MNLLQGKEEPNEDEMFNLVSSLKKVEYFYNPHNMSQWRIWDTMFDILLKLKECLANNEEVKLPVEALRSAICACYYGLVGDRHYLEETAGRETTGKDVNDLRGRFDKYILLMQEMMFQEVALDGSKVLREEAFVSVCDLLLFFSPHAIKAKTDDGKPHSLVSRLLPQ